MDSMPDVIVVTGVSGAGKSVVLRTLEDLGFFCIDNLPGSLLSSFLQAAPAHKVALGIDIRGGAMDEVVAHLQQARKSSPHSVKIIFVTATMATLLKRFQETRRRHPWGDSRDLRDALEEEKRLLLPLEMLADPVIDTDQLTIHQLRALVRGLFEVGKAPQLTVTLTSFGFKYGVPPEHNFVFDARSLPNPYFIPELRPLDGTSDLIKNYLFEQSEVVEYWDKLFDFFVFSLRNAHREGRFVMQVAIGCTGGRHRSVALVEKLAKLPLEQVQFFVKHRDIDRDLK
jgi:UPF0042 nucleotide-binding protein